MPKSYSKNAKKHPDKQLKLIAKSLKEYGWRQPIVVDKNDTIIVGHGRWMAYEKYPEGIKEPWIVKADDLTLEQVRGYRLMDNKTNESDWDMDLAIEELKELDNLGFDIELTGFDKDLLIEPDAKDDEIPENAPPVAQTGDLWALGDHRVLCGDSTKKEDVERLMGGKNADMVFTSPPYSDMREYGGGKDLSLEVLTRFINTLEPYTDYQVINLGIQRKDGEIYPYWDEYLLKAKRVGYKLLSWNVWNKMEACSVANQTSMFATEHEWIFVFGKESKKLKRTVPNKNAGSTQDHNWNRQKDGSLVKAKTTITKTHRQLGTVLNVTPQKARNVDSSHPAMFPVEFPEKYILAMAEESVIDPFLGSGSTLIAAEKTGRICYGMEIDPKYCDVIIKRYEEYTGNKGVKVA